MKYYLQTLVLAGTLFLFNACSTISPYSETAYQQTTDLKAEALTLMAKAGDSYDDHTKDVAALKLDLMKAYEYAEGRPKNDLSIKQWEIMMDPNGNALGGFLTRWQKSGHLDSGFIQEASTQIGSDFDKISGLESGKTKESN